MSKILDELSRDMEQAEAGMEQLANSVGIFWNQLKQQGLTRKEATELTAVWLNGMMSTLRPPGKSDD